MLDQVLHLAGITRIIWVDDQFDPPRGDERHFGELLAAAYSLNATPTHARLSHLAEERDIDLWTAEASKLARLDDDERRDVIAELRSLCEEGPVDLSPGEVSELRAALPGATCLSLEAWREQRGDLKPTLGDDTLLLFDRQFVVDGKAESLGEVELQDVVLSGAKALVVVLTHSIAAPDAESLRGELATRLDIPASAFAVMAKRAGDPEVVKWLVQSVKTVLTHRMCEHLARTVGQYLRDAADGAVASLLDHSIVDLDKAVFQNSRAEGASEFDVIVRILSLRTRVVAEERIFAELPVHAKQISRLRGIHDIAGPLHVGARASSQLLDWQRDEVYDPGARVNPVHLPLASGDIFESADTARLYVLLAPPCDLAVRANGERRLTEAWFVRLCPDAPSEDSKVPERWRSLPSFRGGEAPWRLDYSKACSVSLEFLDYCVFNATGDVRLAVAQCEPDMLLPGWRVRFGKAMARLRRAVDAAAPESGGSAAKTGKAQRVVKRDVPSGEFLLALGGELKALRLGKLDPVAKEVLFAFQRVGRLRQPYARAAYDGLFRFHLRPAFEFEFAKGTGYSEVGGSADEDGGDAGDAGSASRAER